MKNYGLPLVTVIKALLWYMTGRLVEEMIHDKPLLVDVAPFSAQRFSN